MRPSFEAARPVRRNGFRWLVVGIVVIGFAAGAWLTYRVTSFSTSVFGGSERPAMLAAADLDSEDGAGPDLDPTAQPPPMATPTVPPSPVATAPPEPTATLAPVSTATPVSDSSVLGKVRAGQRVNFLLIGYGGPGHDGAYLTDALVVVSYDPRASQVALFNLPRDLWVQPLGPTGRPTGGFRRINEIYSQELGQAVLAGRSATAQEHDRAAWATAAVAQQILGLPIDGWLSADFNAVRQVIDGLGGVTVNVETAFDDYEYPRNDDASINSGVMHVHFNSGPQRLTGERALQYSRSRHALQDGTDFGRARRQQRLLLAVKDEALQPSTLPKVFTLMEAVQGHLRTSLSLAEARDLAVVGRDRNANVQAVPSLIDSSALLIGTVTDGGASVLVPRAGAGNYSAIQQFVRSAIRPILDNAPPRKA